MFASRGGLEVTARSLTLRERHVNCGLQRAVRRFYGPKQRKKCSGLREVEKTEVSSPSGTGSPADVTGRGWHDAPNGQHAEESFAARIAAVGGKLHPALGGDKRALVNALARKTLEIEVSTLRAVSVTREGHGNPPSIKSAIARVASPRFQVEQGKRVVQKSFAV
jgi:hypothetical protein